MNENWCALCIAIILKTPPETAFQILDIGQRNRKSVLDFDDTRYMIKLKSEGLTYKQIGDMYGISDTAVCKRMSYYKKVKDRSTAMETVGSQNRLVNA